MTVSRRRFLITGATAPLLSSCATDLSTLGDEPVAALAERLGIRATYVTFYGGKAAAPVALPGFPRNGPAQQDTLFQAASLTKPVIAFVALKLAKEGMLDLEAPVSTYLPNGYRHRQYPFLKLSNRPSVDMVSPDLLARIPIATLLNHSSGLPNWSSGALVSQFPAGQRWQYSGEAYVLLEAVISSLTGQDIESWIADYVFRPLGMRHSRIRLTDDMAGKLVNTASGFPWIRPIAFTEPNAAASLYTTAEDYGMLISALLGDRALLSMTLADPIMTDRELGLAWGRGWGIETADGGPYLWHWGNNPGYRAFAMVSAASGNGFVVFTNSGKGMGLAVSLAHSTIPAQHGVFRFGMLA